MAIATSQAAIIDLNQQPKSYAGLLIEAV